MRNLSINSSNLTKHIKNSIEDIGNISKSDGVFVETYKDLVKEIAELSYLNPDFMLFFRGQVIDYRNKSSSTTLYPSIYREERISKSELRYKFDVLSTASNLLVNKLEERDIIGNKELKRKKQLQWSILQHYEVCPTPLLDVTHSLRVACSFSVLDNENEFSYIYILALPYITGRISINSEYDLVNIRLLSISPPQALRPFFQEGYLVGTEYICDEYENKSELDFNRRLLVKYKIPNSKSFWGEDFNRINRSILYPEHDIVYEMCNEIKNKLHYEVSVGNESIGRFLYNWNEFEKIFRSLDGRQYNTNQSIKYLLNSRQFDNFGLSKLDDLRKFRNKVVHDPSSITSEDISKYDMLLEYILSSFKQFSKIKNNVG